MNSDIDIEWPHKVDSKCWFLLNTENGKWWWWRSVMRQALKVSNRGYIDRGVSLQMSSHLLFKTLSLSQSAFPSPHHTNLSHGLSWPTTWWGGYS